MRKKILCCNLSCKIITDKKKQSNKRCKFLLYPQTTDCGVIELPDWWSLNKNHLFYQSTELSADICSVLLGPTRIRERQLCTFSYHANFAESFHYTRKATTIWNSNEHLPSVVFINIIMESWFQTFPLMNNSFLETYTC